MIADLGLDTVDMNGNGKIDYIMIEGDRRTFDASIVQSTPSKLLKMPD